MRLITSLAALLSVTAIAPLSRAGELSKPERAALWGPNDSIPRAEAFQRLFASRGFHTAAAQMGRIIQLAREGHPLSLNNAGAHVEVDGKMIWVHAFIDSGSEERLAEVKSGESKAIPGGDETVGLRDEIIEVRSGGIIERTHVNLKSRAEGRNHDHVGRGTTRTDRVSLSGKVLDRGTVGPTHELVFNHQSYLTFIAHSPNGSHEDYVRSGGLDVNLLSKRSGPRRGGARRGRARSR